MWPYPPLKTLGVVLLPKKSLEQSTMPMTSRPEKSAENCKIGQNRPKTHIGGHRWGHMGTFDMDIRPQGVPMVHPNTLGIHIYTYLIYPRSGPAQKKFSPKHVLQKGEKNLRNSDVIGWWPDPFLNSKFFFRGVEKPNTGLKNQIQGFSLILQWFLNELSVVGNEGEDPSLDKVFGWVC